jgi:hypothetical protein
MHPQRSTGQQPPEWASAMTKPPPQDQGHLTTTEWDLFIAHASEDKVGFVRPLAARLSELGARVWYDEFELGPGDSVVKTINRGLARSAYGLLVLSPAFLQKPWPEYEWRGLVTLEIAGSNVVIPIWHNVSHSQIAAYSPPLVDKYALTGDDTDTLALEILAVVRADIFESLARRAAFEKYEQSLPVKNVRVCRHHHGAAYPARNIAEGDVVEAPSPTRGSLRGVFGSVRGDGA